MGTALTRTVCVVALLTFMFVPMRASRTSAVVVKGQTCGLLDGDGGFVIGGDSITVTNNGGVASVVCKAKKVPNSSGQSVEWNFHNTGFWCETANGETRDWKEHVSASGNATLTCHVKN